MTTKKKAEPKRDAKWFDPNSSEPQVGPTSVNSLQVKAQAKGEQSQS